MCCTRKRVLRDLWAREEGSAGRPWKIREPRQQPHIINAALYRDRDRAAQHKCRVELRRGRGNGSERSIKSRTGWRVEEREREGSQVRAPVMLAANRNFS